MIIAPLVFSTLVVGMAKMGDIQNCRAHRIKALLWFFSASIFSLLLGMLLVNVLEPGSSLHIALPPIGAEQDCRKLSRHWGISSRIYFPKSIIEAMANNEILQIVVFSMFFGIACASIGDLAKPTVKLLDSLAHIMLKVTGYVHALCTGGGICRYRLGYRPTWHRCPAVLRQIYRGILFWAIVAVQCARLRGLSISRPRVLSLLRHIREPMLLAFGTAQ